MSDNALSKRTRAENLINTRAQSFRENLRSSHSLLANKSALTTLADKLYSPVANKQFRQTSSLKVRSRSAISIQPAGINPEALALTVVNEAMKGLSSRANSITQYATLNTDLLLQKKHLENQIKKRKEAIAAQNKKLNTATTNAKTADNECAKTRGLLDDSIQRSNHLRAQIDINKAENSNLTQENQHLHKDIASLVDRIKWETQTRNELFNRVSVYRAQLLAEEKQRNKVKADLIKAQKQMTSVTALTRELENQRAKVLIDINKHVDLNKLEK